MAHCSPPSPATPRWPRRSRCAHSPKAAPRASSADRRPDPAIQNQNEKGRGVIRALLLWSRDSNLHRVGARGGGAAAAGPVRVEELAARFVHALVGVRAEIVALRLKQVRGQVRRAVAIEESEGGAEGGDGN